MTLNKETSNEGFENKLPSSVLLCMRVHRFCLKARKVLPANESLSKSKTYSWRMRKKLASRTYNSTLRFVRQYCARRLSFISVVALFAY